MELILDDGACLITVQISAAKKNGPFDPTIVKMLSQCRFDGAGGAEEREECLGVDGVAFRRRLNTWLEIPLVRARWS